MSDPTASPLPTVHESEALMARDIPEAHNYVGRVLGPCCGDVLAALGITSRP